MENVLKKEGMSMMANVSGEHAGELNMNLTVKKASEFEDMEGEEAYGVYSGDLLLGVFWNKELANIFKEAAKNADLKVTS